MATLRYPVLQSGFLALSEVGLSKPIVSNPSFAETILFREVNREFEPYFYSQEVTDLYKEWMGNRHILRDFDFRDKVLRQAMARFGSNLVDWMDFQSNKPGFDNTHKQFLEKIAMHIQSPSLNIDEGVEAVQWLSLLGPGVGNDISFNYHKWATLQGADVNAGSTSKAVINWVSREGGYSSLLTYMFVIFGERVIHLQKMA